MGDTLRKGDSSKEFRKALKNPTKPINNTETTPEMEDYLKKLNNGDDIREEVERVKAQDDKRKEELKKRKEICPHCRRGKLKKTPSGVYCCGVCGCVSNSPHYMYQK